MPGKPLKKKGADLKKQKKVHANGDILVQDPPAGQQPIPVVALGASAGGLEALEAFFHKCRRPPGVPLS